MKDILLITILTLVVGCATGGGSANGATSKANIKFQALGGLAANAVTCFASKETLQPDGRLEVRANVHNRLGKRIQVQVNCVFKDAEGFSTGDETPFQSLILDERGQKTVTFTSLNKKAKDYTVQVRLQR
ncbi:MAG: YcfL family protein [Verrucomicrobiota bacterium]|nr:YcfL family protein [Verrucomicrobiota bacterium]